MIRSALSTSLASSWDQTYIAVATEMLKQLNLSQGALGQDLLAEDIGDLLDSNTFTGLDVRSGTR